MDGIEKFLLGSIAVMFILYLSALPFVNHYSSLDELNEIQAERALVAETQVTTAFGSVIILVIFLVVYSVSQHYDMRERL